MTLALVFYKLRLVTSLRGAGEVRVVLIGAAARTEERLLLETSYWAEAGCLLPTIDGLHLCFVGHEVSGGRGALCGRRCVLGPVYPPGRNRIPKTKTPVCVCLSKEVNNQQHSLGLGGGVWVIT